MRIYEFTENLAKVAQQAARVIAKPGVATTTARVGTAVVRAMCDVAGERAAKAGVKLAPLTAKLFDKTTKKLVDRTVPIVNHSGRAIVVVEINGQRMPFYLSSGEVAKVGVTPGKWYPTFGIGSDGWINKAANVGTYYGKPELANMARKLDASIGDIRSLLDDVSDFGSAKFAIDDINRGMNPVTLAQGETGGLKAPAYALFAKMGI